MQRIRGVLIIYSIFSLVIYFKQNIPMIYVIFILGFIKDFLSVYFKLTFNSIFVEISNFTPKYINCTYM